MPPAVYQASDLARRHPSGVIRSQGARRQFDAVTDLSSLPMLTVVLISSNPTDGALRRSRPRFRPAQQCQHLKLSRSKTSRGPRPITFVSCFSNHAGEEVPASWSPAPSG